MLALYTCIILALATATASLTITHAVIFRPVRNLAEKLGTWMGELFACPYCFSHWVSLFFVLIYRPRLIEFNIVIDLGVSWLVIIGIASVFSAAIFKAVDIIG
jgi:hypothetical protein